MKWAGIYLYHAMFAQPSCFVGTEMAEPQSKQTTAEESLKGNTGNTNTEGLLVVVYELIALAAWCVLKITFFILRFCNIL